MPERFLLQILRDLTKKGILCSTRGGGGGFALTRPAHEITLLELVEAIDGPIATGLPNNLSFPDRSDAILRNTLNRITDAARRQLATVTINDLAGQGGNGQRHQAATQEPTDPADNESAGSPHRNGPEPVEASEEADSNAPPPRRHPPIPAPRHLDVFTTQVTAGS